MHVQIKQIIITVTVILTLGIMGATLWRHQLKPTIDDATVVSDVVLISSQVDGPIIEMKVKDYQKVKKGDLLYEIDPKPFQISLERAKSIIEQTKQQIQELEDNVNTAQAFLDKAESDLELAKKDYKRKQILEEQGAVSQSDLDKSTANLKASEALVNVSKANVSKAKHALGQTGEKNAQLRTAVADEHNNQLNLDYTKVHAPVDGYVTNLRISKGSYVNKGEPAMTVISDNGWRVIALARETQLRHIKEGQEVSIYFPAYPDKKFKGKVYGIGWGIAPSIIETVTEGLTEVSPTLDWVRLAQRFPVRISFDKKDKNYPLRVGMTATVQIDTTKP